MKTKVVVRIFNMWVPLKPQPNLILAQIKVRIRCQIHSWPLCGSSFKELARLPSWLLSKAIKGREKMTCSGKNFLLMCPVFPFVFFLPWHIPSIIGRGGHNKAELAVSVTSQGHEGEVYMNLMKIVLFAFLFPLAWKRGTVMSQCKTKTSWCGHVAAAGWGALPSSRFYNCGFTSRPTGYINSIIA